MRHDVNPFARSGPLRASASRKIEQGKKHDRTHLEPSTNGMHASMQGHFLPPPYLVGQALLPVRACYVTIIAGRQECLSYPRFARMPAIAYHCKLSADQATRL